MHLMSELRQTCLSLDWETDTEDESNHESTDESSEEEWYREEPERKKRRNTLSMAKTAEISARFDISAEATAAVCNAYMADRGENLKENPDRVVSESSFRYKKKKVLTTLANKPIADATSVYLDGKRYETLVIETGNNGTSKQVKKVLEHFVVANPENQEYIGEYVPASGTGKDVALGLKELPEQKV